nr:glycosyltransferase [uncultured Butyrivibrio sp.]
MNSLDVIIPVYNNAPYLKKCFDSILSTKDIIVNLLLIDDGSDDGSGAICDEYANDHDNVKTFHKPNGGVMSAISYGIEKSKGTYITIVDSDDWIEAETYDCISELLCREPDVIVYPIFRYFSDENVYKEETYFSGEYSRERILNEIFPMMIWSVPDSRFGLDPSLCNKIFKKDLLKKYVEKSSYLTGNYGQDVAILYPLMKEVNSAIFIERGAYYHRQRADSQVAPYFKKQDYAQKLYELYEHLLTEFDDYEDIKRQIDYFYAYSVNLRLRAYGEEIPRRYYFFPYSSVPYNSRIILYGAGKIGKMYLSQLKKNPAYRIVAWIDKNVEGNIEEFKIAKPWQITDFDFDYVVIAIENGSIAEAVINELGSIGIEREKIVWAIDCVKF